MQLFLKKVAFSFRNYREFPVILVKQGKMNRELNRDIPKIIKFKATNSLRVSCLFCIFKHSPQKTV